MVTCVTVIVSPAGMQVHAPGDALDANIEAIIAELRKAHGDDKVTVHRFVGNFEYSPDRNQ